MDIRQNKAPGTLREGIQTQDIWGGFLSSTEYSPSYLQ